MPALFHTETPLVTSSDSILRSRIVRRAFATGPDTFASYQSTRKVIWTIIGLNAAVFGAWQYATINRDQNLYRKLTDNFTVSLRNWKEGRVWTLLTSAMSHQMLFHFAFRSVQALSPFVKPR